MEKTKIFVIVAISLLLACIRSVAQIQQTEGPIGGCFTDVIILNKTWIDISTGANHVLAIDQEGILWGWGLNEYGQIDGQFDKVIYNPVIIDSSKKWISVAAGTSHSLGVDSKGNLYSWGKGEQGELGHREKRNLSRFKRVDSVAVNLASRISADKIIFKKVAAGNKFSIALTENNQSVGQIYAFGDNITSGALGLELIYTYDIPTLIDSSVQSVDIVCGYGNSFAIKEDGSLWGWGLNDNGQLGNDSTKYYNNELKRITKDKDWWQVSAGVNHTIALKKDSTLWAWGQNTYGQLGDSTNTSKLVPTKIGKKKWKSISAGNYFTLAIDDNDLLFVWGANHKGQLGTGNTFYYNYPLNTEKYYKRIFAGFDYSIAINSSGDLEGVGDNYSGKAGLGISKIEDTNRNRIGNGFYCIWALNKSYGDKVYVSRDKGLNWNWENYNKGLEKSGPEFVWKMKKYKSEIYLAGGGVNSSTSDLGYSWYISSGNNDFKHKLILGIESTPYGSNGLIEKEGYPYVYLRNSRVSWDGIEGQPRGIKDGIYNISIDRIKTIESLDWRDDFSLMSSSHFGGTSYIYLASFEMLFNETPWVNKLGTVYDPIYNSSIIDFSYKQDSLLIASKSCIYKDLLKGGVNTPTYFKPISDSTKNYNFSGFEYQGDFGIAISNGLGIFRLNNNLQMDQVPIKMQYITDFKSIGKSLYVSTKGGGVYKTTDYGAKWEDISERIYDRNIFKLSVIDKKLYCSSEKDEYMLDNSIWKKIDSFDIDTMSIINNWGLNFRVKDIIQINENKVILVELYDRIYFKKNIIVIKPKNLSAYQLTNLPKLVEDKETYSILSENNNLWLSNSGGLFKSSDVGLNWQQISTPIPIGELVYADSTLFGRINDGFNTKLDSSIIFSKDSGSSWEYFYSANNQNSISGKFSKIYVSGGAIYAIINNKLWYSPVSSANWKQSQISNDNLDSNIRFTTVFEFEGNLFLGTEAHSVWRTQLSPVLILPQDSANNVKSTNIDFEWSKSKNGVLLYEFQLSEDLEFTNIIHKEELNSTHLTFTKELESAHQYFWKVRLKNSEGIWSPWSAINVFATEFPEMIIKLSPETNYLNRSMIQPFYFVDQQNNENWGYQLQTADDKNFTQNVVTHYYDTLFFFHQFEKGENYYYRIRQFDTTISFGGKWYPESNYHLLSVAPVQIDFSPHRDVFSFGNYPSLLWQPEHYNKFDYSQFPGLEGTPKSWYPGYHDFYAAFGWQHIYVECCCIRRYLFFGPKKCQAKENYNTITKWHQALRLWGYKWGGSCLGFSFHSIERWLKNERPYSFQIPFNDAIQSKINQQQQFSISRTYYNSTYKRNALGAVEFLRSVFNSNNKSMLPVLSINAYNKEHAIVPYMITSGSQFDSIWVYDNWYHFTPDLDNISWTNKFILVNKSNGHWHFPNGFPEEGGWHATIMDLTPITSFVYSRPLLKVNKNKDENQSKKKRGEFLLSSNDSLVATTIFINNPEGFVIKDSRGKEHSLNDYNTLDSSNIHIIKMFGGLKEQPTLKILGAHIFADDEKSEYSIENINTNSNDTASINIFGLGYDGEVKWKGGNDSKVSVIISDMNHGIKLKSENQNEIIDFLVVKKDEELDYQKSIKIDKTSLSDNEEFYAGFSPDSKEFRITNNGEDKEYDIVVDLGIEIPLTDVKFDSKDTHIYTLEGLGEEDTTKLTIKIDRSGSGKPDTTIVYDGKIDSTSFVAEWYNSKETESTQIQIYPNPVKDDLTLKLLLNKSNPIEVKIIDAQGKEVKTVINDFRAMGEYIISTDIRELSQGLYFLTITTPEQVISESFLIIK